MSTAAGNWHDALMQETALEGIHGLFEAPPPPATFTKFPDLPYELRCAIWRQSFVPRMVEVEYNCDEEKSTGFSSSAKLPIALSICKESRKFAVESYPLCFGSLCFQPRIRFNFSIDVLYLTVDLDDSILMFLSILSEKERSQLRYLAFEKDATEQLSSMMSMPLKPALRAFTGLEEFIIIYDVHEHGYPRIHQDATKDMILYNELPSQLHASHEHLLTLMDSGDWKDFEVWETKKCRPVWGWKKCTCNTVIEPDDESDEEDHGHFGFGYGYGPYGYDGDSWGNSWSDEMDEDEDEGDADGDADDDDADNDELPDLI
ncbi:hypothetical protein BGZ60DRAFT_529581 [Tricladium varicosporioides]|nr:hypothetical protein BGZ60DRAFT_529581 [Hymenoscyphus varicosporioides]